jgi:hypothetical protein
MVAEPLPTGRKVMFKLAGIPSLRKRDLASGLNQVTGVSNVTWLQGTLYVFSASSSQTFSGKPEALKVEGCPGVTSNLRVRRSTEVFATITFSSRHWTSDGVSVKNS